MSGQKPYIKDDVGQQPATTTFEVEDSVERFATETRPTAGLRALSRLVIEVRRRRSVVPVLLHNAGVRADQAITQTNWGQYSSLTFDVISGGDRDQESL